MKVFVYVLFLRLIVFASDAHPLEKNKCPSLHEGICFNTTTKIDPKAVERAKYITFKMLQNSPEIKKKMVKAHFTIEIIGQKQNLSDIPRYRHLKNKKTFDGRTYDDGTRGVGDDEAASIGEENLLCLAKQKFWEENILVHEFAHSIKYSLSADLSKKIDEAYENAKSKKLYKKDIYMMANSHEYWAEATQAWFNATARSDVNDGINSRTKIKKHDPTISKLLETVYGTVEIDRSVGCRY